ncbi:SDR family mycofactocin-dependent oxidoreductase [Kitasatospora sp. Ki12]|uniref:mycofactocin-coupled SDR family oxidoreductase n=1 Tax=Kitasatospora xanthocidica TaxID=83382 RepID=UPI001671DDA1|nr:mycofactocin-coupled SDR family oxidoreductase [Kitasatospora xanthocidica]GHF89351.1 3-ketoacyl-ACP reductase [Kitasatospora xanthocidica]
MGRVQDKVVLITGAARGLGRSHALRLAEEGADIIAVDVCKDPSAAHYAGSTVSDLDETVELVRKTGRRAVAKQADVRDRAALAAAIAEAVEELGRLDVVIPNAGINPVGNDLPVTAFTDTVDINLVGAINTVHAALPHLGEGASIIVIGSVVALMPRFDGMGIGGPGNAGYNFTKSMLTEYADWLGVQLAPHNQRVNVVHPTTVATELMQNTTMYKTFRPDLENPTADDVAGALHAVHGLPVAFLEPADVSHAIVYLASEESRFVTGTQLRVDAGMINKLAAGARPGA